MEIREITDKNLWENFYYEIKEKTFLNSWNWGEFQERLGNKIWRWGIFQDKQLLSLALILKIKAKRGSFLFLPHCPTISEKFSLQKKEIFECLVRNLKLLAGEEKVNFLRIAPLWENTPDNQQLFRYLGFKEAPIHIHPEITLELNIEKEKEELLRGMRKTTRYLIRQAEKNSEIQIIEDNTIEGLKEFNQIYQITKERHRFIPFSFDYLEKEFFTFLKDKEAFLLLGKYRRETVAGGIFIFWQRICFYHHGASSQKYPKIPVSYLLLWEAIKKAKSLGGERFNFWGISPSSNPKHPWAGLTLFKMGFGGEKREYLKTQDLPLSPLYLFNFLIEKVRKLKRGL